MSVRFFGFRRPGFAQRPGEIILHPIQNAINESSGIRTAESFGQLNRFVDRNDRRYVVTVKHFVNCEPEDIPIHCGDPMKLVVVAVLADAIVDLGQMRDHAVDERLGEGSHPRRGRAEFPKLVHAFGRAVAMQMGVALLPRRCAESEIARGELMPDKFLAINPGNVTHPLNGTPTKEPTFGLSAYWISKDAREHAQISRRALEIVFAHTGVLSSLPGGGLIEI